MKEDILSGFSAVYGEISKGGNEDEKGFVDFDSEEDMAAVRIGKASAPIGKPRAAADISLPAP